ncbi:unnamed protein product [Phytomonas sp. EM1]|nr:unnamed protein product [Phytomonas sp. EM1]|eukprot:CCW60649.1 unnamed protein product [Phytomonas sp. isolate EM1]
MNSMRNGYNNKVAVEYFYTIGNESCREHGSPHAPLFCSKYSLPSIRTGSCSVFSSCTNESATTFPRRFGRHVSSPLSDVPSSYVSPVVTSHGGHEIKYWASEVSSASRLLGPNHLREAHGSINVEIGTDAQDNRYVNSPSVQERDLTHSLLNRRVYPPSFYSSTHFIRLCVTYFCFVNAFLSFLFAWMMFRQHVAFSLVSVRQNWNSSARSRACAFAGFYYLLMYFLLLTDCVWTFPSLIYQCIIFVYMFIQHSRMAHFLRYYRHHLFHSADLVIGEANGFELVSIPPKSRKKVIRTSASPRVGLKLRERLRIPSK